MSNENKILAGVGIVTVILVIVAVFSLGGNKSAENQTANEPPKDAKLLINEKSYIYNPQLANKAKVTIVEFGDFECPACGSAYPVINQLMGEYEGKVQFVYRNYPLPIHKHARVAAQTAEAAGAQGKFYEMYGKIFDNQKEWSESKDPLKEHFLVYAKELGLDVAKLEKEVKENKYNDKIEKDIADGNAAGVNATPTFFINGIKQEGGLPYQEFKAKVEAELNKK